MTPRSAVRIGLVASLLTLQPLGAQSVQSPDTVVAHWVLAARRNGHVARLGVCFHKPIVWFR